VKLKKKKQWTNLRIVKIGISSSYVDGNSQPVRPTYGYVAIAQLGREDFGHADDDAASQQPRDNSCKYKWLLDAYNKLIYVLVN
jgi:hypothetical protein